MKLQDKFETFLVGLCLSVFSVPIWSEPVNAESQDEDTVQTGAGRAEATDRFTRLQNEVIDLIDNYRYKEAEQKFLELITFLSQEYGANSNPVSRTKENLAVLYTEMHKYQEAESLLKSVLINKENASAKGSEKLARIFKKLGVVYARSGNYEVAWTYFSKASAIIEKNSKESDPYLIAYIADLKSSQGLYRESIGLCKKALTAAESLSTTDVNLITGIQSCQAGIYLETGELNKATELYSQILTSKLALKGEEDPSVADAKIDMAIVYFQLGKVAEAQTLVSQAIPIQERTYGNFSIEVAKTLSVSSDLVLAAGKLTEAKELIRKSMEIRQNVSGSKHPGAATGLFKLATVEILERNMADAETHCLQALEIDRKIAGEHHPNYAKGLAILARIYQEQGNLKKAKSLYAQALAVLSKVLPSNSGELRAIRTAHKNILTIDATPRAFQTQDRPFR